MLYRYDIILGKQKRYRIQIYYNCPNCNMKYNIIIEELAIIYIHRNKDITSD